jgi:diguanylate cyclase (GGDEF)-like protein
MKPLEHITKITPYIDDAFNEFYNAMLSDPKLSIFFKSDEQIRNLIKMQKAHFLKTIDMRESEIKEAYVKLGEYHYDIRIPYVDFIKGAEMLEEYFLLHTRHADISSRELMDDIFTYFKYMKSFTAKGYLNRMIDEDKKDIDNFFLYSEKGTTLQAEEATAKIKWLRELLDKIIEESDVDLDNMDSLLNSWLKEIAQFSQEKRDFINDLEKRIIINTQNLFYFLKKQDYLEILPLYSSLLAIYKLTLLLNNLLTVDIASQTITSLRVDALSQLLRRESYEEFLRKEISYAQREKEYTFSLAYLDLDNFKHVNDNFGHYSGDRVIEKFGEIIRSSIRGSDLAFRIGGDEFAIIFKNATREQAKMVCQKIKVEFSAYEFVFNKEKMFNVGVSIGIEEFDREKDIDLESIIENVDTKLYDAKNMGKNQISY